MTDSRIAFVTGGGGGIGAAICRSLAAAGHKVAVSDIAVDNARAVAQEIGGLAVETDVADAASVASSAENVLSELGPVDILVNCAGWDLFMPFVETDEAFMAKVLAINLAGPMRVTRTFLPGMIERSWGRLIHISSDAGRVGSSFEAIYSGAKGGIIAFSKTMARETARKGVTSNCVCPGPTETALLQSVVGDGEKSERMMEGLKRAVPMRRLGQPEDIGPAVTFLASEDAAFITGQTLSVSGGLTMA